MSTETGQGTEVFACKQTSVVITVVRVRVPEQRHALAEHGLEVAF